jgi:hypothetical protein
MSESGMVEKPAIGFGKSKQYPLVCPIFHRKAAYAGDRDGHSESRRGRLGKPENPFTELARSATNAMIRHIVMWKLKDSAEGASRDENALKLKDKLEGCRDIVPGILHLEVGLAGPGLESTFDVVMVSDFADRAALDAYQVHPTHQALKTFVGAVREARQSVDYEV